MIRMIQSHSAANAKKYFNEALSQTDYFLNSQEVCGRFQGKASARLNTGETVTQELFHRLCDNLNPVTGKALTLRTKDYRTIGYDINFHCPKSISILHAFAKDDHILNAFQQSVQKTMLNIETNSQVRVRKHGKDENRNTAELIWSEFIHLTSRPVKGAVPDPHLHCHCFTFNATWDPFEQCYKAVQFADIKRDMPYFQAQFYKEFSNSLIELGYQIRSNKNSFEIIGVPEPVIDLFSKRSREITAIAKAEGIADQKKLDGLGARTRANKQKGLSMDRLTKEWAKQISALDDGVENKAIRFAPIPPDPSPLTAQQCIDHAITHCFERASVVHERRILATAYSHSIGKRHISIEQINECFNKDNRLIRVKDGSKILCTTEEVMNEEKRMVYLAIRGKGRLQPLYAVCPELALSGQQGEAVRHVLTNLNRVVIIRGQAGTGKTTLMQEAVNHIEQTGKKVIVVAPTAQASRGVLRDEGFHDAETVAKLLSCAEQQEQLKDGVLWVDEAGLLGTKDMTALLDLVTAKNARLILAGDTRQHTSVMRGDALRILNTVAGIQAAEVSRIYRQKKEDYRLAVQALAQENVKEGFERLDAMGAIKQIDPEIPYQLLVEEYYSALKKRKSALVVCPTHYQGDLVTAEIRKKLRKEKKIGKEDHPYLRLVSVNMTAAEKKDWRNYQSDQVIQFSQNLKGFKRGSSWCIRSIDNGFIHITDKEGNLNHLPLDQSQSFEIYRQAAIDLAKGDAIRVTRNGFDKEKKRLNNGQTLKIVSIEKDGTIRCKNTISKSKYLLPTDFGHLAHAHCVTSHASQGKTVDEVFIFQNVKTFQATNAQQFYVSVSRAKHTLHVYTDDPTGLLFHASKVGDRTSALEMMREEETRHTGEQITRVNIQGETLPEINTRSNETNYNQTRRTNGFIPAL